MTKKEALKLVAVLEAAYPRQELRKDTVEVYARFLGDLDYPVTQKVLSDHIRTSKWFPTIAEIRGAVAEAVYRLPHTEDAMALTKNAVRCGDYGVIRRNPLLAEAIETVGWHKLQYSEYPEPLYRQVQQAYEKLRGRAMQDLAGAEGLGLDAQRLALLPYGGEVEADG